MGWSAPERENLNQKKSKKLSSKDFFKKKYHLRYMEPSKIEDELEDGEHLSKEKRCKIKFLLEHKGPA